MDSSVADSPQRETLAVISQRLVWFDLNHGFRPYFGDMTLWNILASCTVTLYTSPYPYMTNVRLWAHGRSVAS